MSWKEKQLITVLSTILAVLVAAVLIVLSIRYRAAQSAAEDPQSVAAELAETARSEYVRLSYSNDSAYLAFALDENGAWYWENEPNFPLNGETIRSLLALLSDLKPQQTLERPEDLSECGLDSPLASLTATAPDGGVLSIAMGNATTDGTSCYADINSSAEHIYIISNELYQVMQTPIYDMCLLPQLPELPEERLSSVMLQSPAEEGADEDGNPVDVHTTTILSATHTEGEDTVSWRSGGANVTDTAKVRALLEDLASLQVSACVDYRPSDEAAAFCGFDNPAVLTVSYRSATGTEETFRLSIGNQNMDGTGRYVRIGEEAAIYLMELEQLDPMVPIAYQGLE